eukprot:26274-Eustigmatos_ZCMA.PRE.1
MAPPPVTNPLPLFREMRASDPPTDQGEITQISDKITYDDLRLPYDPASTRRRSTSSLVPDQMMQNTTTAPSHTAFVSLPMTRGGAARLR